ncbi:hypothetical protein NBRC3299_1248 [Acetobacter pasteurianus NBRC 3299]|nr:hypothetical protein NBRC3299_1248 [Acetobacter pasteurianus NBRC 3299]
MTRGVISERTYIARSPLFWSEYTLPRLCDIGLQQGRRQAHVEGSRLGFDLKAHGLETGQVIPGQIDGRDEILGRFVTVQRGHGPIFVAHTGRSPSDGFDRAWISLYQRIMGQQKHSFHRGLCHKDPIKGIPMHIWQLSDCQGVLAGDR